MPSSFKKLQNLKTLDLRSNYLTELPITFGELKSLEELDLRYNKFTEIPYTIWRLKNLQQYHLKLQGNPLSVDSRKISNLEISKILHYCRMRDPKAPKGPLKER